MTEPLSYTLLDPTGNITLLAETPVPEASQPLTAKRLMELEPATEQVGFVRILENGIDLRMAGGEFCGNASMSAAVLYLLRKNRDSGEVTVRVSGTPQPVKVAAEKQADGSWRGCVEMPHPLSVGRERFSDGSVRPVVRFPGITHVVLEEEMEQPAAEKLAPLWCRELESEALGLMFLDRERGILKPLVYVPTADTLFWESSCASGTTAVGAFLAAESGAAVRLPLKQPGGILEIEAEPGGRLLLKGSVRLIRQASDIRPEERTELQNHI